MSQTTNNIRTKRTLLEKTLSFDCIAMMEAYYIVILGFPLLQEFDALPVTRIINVLEVSRHIQECIVMR